MDALESSDLLRLRDYLQVPYRLEAVAVEVDEGKWLRRLSYPELGDFFAEGLDVERALVDLERKRVRCITELVLAGQCPPVPRAPSKNSDPEWLLRELGFGPELILELDRSPADFK